jgi:Ca2+-binding EF-hand superfamily protein
MESGNRSFFHNKTNNIMKTIQHLILATALLSAANGQTPEGPKPERKGPAGLLAEILAKFDKDGDGKLSDEESKAAREAMQAKRKEAQSKFDTDGDGKISEEERKAMFATRKKEMVAKFDKDGDGVLNDEEKKAARESFGPRPAAPVTPKAAKEGQ